MNKKPYVITKDEIAGVWYCHRRGFEYVPVFGSVGDRQKAQKICDMYNRSVGKGGKNDKTGNCNDVL